MYTFFMWGHVGTKYKNGSKPGEVSEDIYVKNVPLRLNNIAGHLVES